MYMLTTHCVDVLRLTKIGAQEAYSPTPVYLGLDCTILPSSAETISVYPGVNAFALHDIFFDEPVNLKTGDKLVAGAAEWIIRATPQTFDNDYGYAVHAVGEKVT